jgi:hypothetical protein
VKRCQLVLVLDRTNISESLHGNCDRKRKADNWDETLITEV